MRKTKIIPYSRQSLDQEDINAVVKVLKSDWITQGPKIEEFENALCVYTGARYAVCVTNATSALHLACLVLGIKTGDEVVTSPITFVATANAVIYCGGKPVFADIQEDTVNIDPIEIKKKITRKTKAIIPVHFAGYPCDLEEIYQIAKKHNLAVIEDATHALGAEYKGEKIGSCHFSDMTVFSFHPIKLITTGEGGAILTNNRKYYEKLLKLRTHGITKGNFQQKSHGDWYYEMQCLGFNYRLTDFQCALGISQLRKIDNFISRRRKIAEIYNHAFRNNGYFDLPVEKRYVKSAYHLYPVRLKDKFKKKRKKIFDYLRKNNLWVQVHYIPVHLQPYYRKKYGYKKDDYPKAEDYYYKTISLPIFPEMTNREITYIVEKIKRFSSL
jgi:UDP-4-amino-4,6-dideoxy-N-acetyl-beta-L-altrosamine transaminase